MSKIRKTLQPAPAFPATHRALQLAAIACFAISSEKEGYPIEHALEEGPGQWRAAEDGPQTIRITFDKPQSVSHIGMIFEEHEIARSQEFVLLARHEGSDDWNSIVRQQFNFSPPGTVRQSENYAVNLAAVSELELFINPGGGCASLSYLFLNS